MSDTASSPLLQCLLWLAAHARFPAQRLPAKIELALLMTYAAAAENRVVECRQKTGFGPQFGPSTSAHLRTYTLKRNRAHAVCDNSAKV